MAKKKVRIGDDGFLLRLTTPTVCKQCGKAFERPGYSDWVYKRAANWMEMYFFCSLSCLRKYDKSKEKNHDRYFD